MKEPRLSEKDLDRIEGTVAEVERETSGEIVPVLLEQSDDYPGARWRMAIAVALATAFILWMLRPDFHPIWYLWAEVPGLALGYLLGAVASLQRMFLASGEMEVEVRQRALEAFQLLNLRNTRDRTGILILVSILEHRVEIVADEGIHAKVGQDQWKEIVDRLAIRIRRGEITDGLCAAITECGALLKTHFPPRPGDRNELPNRPVYEG